MSERDALGPFCTILAGPNGSGKSSIYPWLKPVGEFVNADVVARKLAPQNPEGASMAAGRLVLATIETMLSERRSFVYETTLSSRQSITVMERCQALGYEIAFVYVALDSPNLNVERVAERVATGGHYIEEAVIRRRYETAFSRLPAALRIANTTAMFDNSGLKPRLLLTVERRQMTKNQLDETKSSAPSPRWLRGGRVSDRTESGPDSVPEHLIPPWLISAGHHTKSNRWSLGRQG